MSETGWRVLATAIFIVGACIMKLLGDNVLAGTLAGSGAMIFTSTRVNGNGNGGK